MSLTFEQVKAINDRVSEEVDVPEWGGTVSVHSMTAKQRAEIEKKWSGKSAGTDPLGFRRDLLLGSLNGWATAEQIDQLLAEKNARPVERLVEAAIRVGGFSKKDVEAIEGN